MPTSSPRVIAVALQVAEPPLASHIGRLRRGEVFLSGTFTHLCLDQLEQRRTISWSFIRYIDPNHLLPATGIVILLRILGSKKAIASARKDVDTWLSANAASAGIVHSHWIDEDDWASTNHRDYGGVETAREFAEFLHSASVLALRLLQGSLRPHREQILNGWRHCFNFTTIGYDWVINGPPSVDAAA